MGCKGCELFSEPEAILSEIDREIVDLNPTWENGQAKEIAESVIEEVYNNLDDPQEGHHKSVTTTNLYHTRKSARDRSSESHDAKYGSVALNVIERSITCYAAKLHLNRCYCIENPDRKVKKGYAPTFEQVTRFPGRLAEASRWSDLTGHDHLFPRKKGKKMKIKHWLKDLPRLIFVSDMGDAFSQEEDLDYLRDEIEAFTTDEGKRHLWLWLTKRPQTMKKFSNSIGGFPPNVCAMTTVTSEKTVSRVDALRKVDAQVRGLSIEPLWGPIAHRLNLDEIDWVIVGGESGAAKNVRPFHLEWALELKDLCEQKNVAFFVKQLGQRPIYSDQELKLADNHGGNWDEWPKGLKIREMPEYFRQYSHSRVNELATV